MQFFDNKGQSFLEGLAVSIIITVFMFAAIQVCIMTVDDMYCNFVSFCAARKVVVSKNKEIESAAKKVVSNILTPYNVQSVSMVSYKNTHWDEQILGNKIADHSGININKHNVKIGYYTRIMFYKLFNSLPHRNQSARARMVKSPDEKYYNKAYPNAKEFPSFKQ